MSLSTQTASYPLALADANKMVEMSVASANNLTIPPNSSVAFRSRPSSMDARSAPARRRFRARRPRLGWIHALSCLSCERRGWHSGDRSAFTRSVWGMYSFSINENGGATASFMGINSSYSTFNAAVTSPGASNASYTPELMAGGNAVSIAGSGARMGVLAIWEGAALSQAGIIAISNPLDHATASNGAFVLAKRLTPESFGVPHNFAVDFHRLVDHQALRQMFGMDLEKRNLDLRLATVAVEFQLLRINAATVDHHEVG
ncbi:hypothetical protein NKI86_31480 [Mesorhizobium sp. M0320]|uniref:hypothetical protein n=1 Tax=Mesorhizobium sp. M0320 TaxID=2956936 RepID=UPI00333C753F